MFLTTFLVLYGGLHLYAFLKAKTALQIGFGITWLLVVLMVMMIFSPLIVRVLERHGFERIPQVLSWVAYMWMGLLFLFVSVSLTIDLYHLLLHLAEMILRGDFSGITFSSRSAFLTGFSLSILIAFYGLFEAFDIRTEHFAIRSPKIPEAVGRIRIVQISDVHLGLIVRQKRLQRILDAVRVAEPDILVSTGDLVDGQMDNMSMLAGMLQGIRTRYGKYAVTGNHEYYAGLGRSLDFTKRAGFTLLSDEGLTIAGVINIVGVNDPAGKNFGRAEPVSEKELLSRFPPGLFTLFLKHRPLVNPVAVDLFDLQLSGHTHKGQIFPFTMVIKLLYPTDAGMVRFPEGFFMYVSRGSGTWGPPMRFLSPPEVTVIDLIHEYQNNPVLEETDKIPEG
jgi:predicted MPP superfamily phosphohydrolase